MDLNILAAQIHENAVSKGFWEDNKSDGHYLMLTVCEMSEGVEADRSPHVNVKMGFTEYVGIYLPILIQAGQPHSEDILFSDWYKSNVKGSIGEELSDTFIRLLDLAGAREIELVLFSDCMSSFRAEVEKLTFCEATYRICQILTSAFMPTADIIKIAISMLYALSDAYGIGLNDEVALKMRFNSTRKMMHGKRY